MDHWTTLAQRQADAIRRRRHAVSDLRLVAELIDDGLPIPLTVGLWRDGLRVHVAAAEVAEWLHRLDIHDATWSRLPDGDGEHLEVATRHLGTPFSLVSFRRAVTEVTC